MVLWITAWGGTALAVPIMDGERPLEVHPVVAPVAVEAQVTAWRKTREVDPGPLACEPIFQGELRLCWRAFDGTKRRWVHVSDIERWGGSVSSWTATARADAAARIHAMTVQEATDGLSYLRASADPRFSADLVMAPDAAQARVASRELRFAAPQLDVVFAWAAATEEGDVMASVEAAELYASATLPLSDMAWRWHEGTWVPWGRAVPARPRATKKGSPNLGDP